MSVKSRSSVFYKNTFANMIFFLFSSLLGFLTVPMFIEKMGTAQYGIWLLSFNIMNYFLLFDSSFSGGVVRAISEAQATEDAEKQANTINLSLAIYFAIGLIVCLIFLSASGFIVSFFSASEEQRELLMQLLKIAAYFALPIWPLKVVDAVFIGLMERPMLNFVKGCAAILSALLILLFLEYGVGLGFLAFVSYSVTVLSGIVLWVLYRRKHREYRFCFRSFCEREMLISILSFSLNLMILEVAALFAFQVDELILAYFLPVSYVAVYAVVTKPFYLLRGVYGMLLSAVQPMIFAAVQKQDRKFIHKVALKGFKYIFLFYVPLIVVAAVMSKPFLLVWLGSSFVPYALWSSVFLLQYLLSPSVGVLGTVAVGMSKLKQVQIYAIVSTLSNFGLSVVFVKLFGFQGVLLGTVVTTMIGVPVIYPHYCKAIALDWRIPIRENYKEFLSLLLFLLLGLWGIDLIRINGWFSLFLYSGAFLCLIYLWMGYMFLYDDDKDKIFEWLRKKM